MLNVEKFIRVLGYIMYTILWSPIVILGLVVLPIVALGLGIRCGKTVKESMAWYFAQLKMGINHDINFIKTGEW